MEMITNRQYISPEIELIVLDNTISLALESDPPVPENEGSLAPQYFRTDPYKVQNG